MPVKRHGRGRGSSRSTRFESLRNPDGRSLEQIEADLAESRARIASFKEAAGITEDMTPWEAREARERYHESQVKQRCKQCKRWVPRADLSPNLKYCKKCIAVHRAEQSAYVNRPLPVASDNPDRTSWPPTSPTSHRAAAEPGDEAAPTCSSRAGRN